MTKLANELLGILTDEPQTRGELSERLSCSDRSLRRAVAELRKNGFNIASNCDTKGYWIGTDEDRKRVANSLKSRAFELLREAYDIERGVDLGQMEVSM